MHVKLVVNSFPSTSETFLFNLVTGLEGKGIKVTVCATARSKDKHLYADKLKRWSGNIQYLDMKPTGVKSLLRFSGALSSAPALLLKVAREKGFKKGVSVFLKANYLLQGNPDIIHFAFSGIGINYLDVLELVQVKQIKTIVSCRGTAEKVKPLLEPGRGKLLQSLFSKIDLVHCVSKDMRDGLIPFGLHPAKTFVNYPSIDPTIFQRNKDLTPLSGRPINIFTTGSLNFSKGYIFALQAMRLLKDREINFIYHILGEGPDRSMITYAIHQFGLQDHVRLYGKVSSVQVFDYLNNADIFLLASVYEGVANAVLEAMSMKIPVVTTRAGGMAEVVENKINGMIVECYDPLAIANAIEELVKSPSLRDLIGEKARKTVLDGFTSEKQLGIFVDNYTKILANKSIDISAQEMR